MSPFSCAIVLFLWTLFFDALRTQTPPYTWNTTALTQARAWLAAASTSNGALIFFGGGMAGGTSYATVDILNTQTGEWTQSALSSARSALAATAVTLSPSLVDASRATSPEQAREQSREQAREQAREEVILFAGGLDANGAPSRTVDIYSLQQQAWSSGTLIIHFF
jgi:hypothetical protein